MKRVYAFFIGVLLVQDAVGQSAYFISIDADQQEAFQVTLGKKVFRSDAYGHLVIPQLSDSVYTLSILFSSGKYSEHVFSVRIDRVDRGFQLKKNSSNRWVLYDWQKMELLAEERSNSREVAVSGNRRSDEFARLMAAVVNDSSVLVQSGQSMSNAPDPIQSKSEIPTGQAANQYSDTTIKMDGKGVRAVGKNDRPSENGKNSSTVAAAPAGVTSAPADTALFPAAVGEGKNRSWSMPSEKVEKLLDNVGAGFRSQLYRDSTAWGVDSVMVRIPVDQPEKGLQPVSEQATLQNTPNTFIQQKPPASIDPLKDTLHEARRVVMVNSDCRFFASEGDIDKLRVKMMEQTAAMDRIELARKAMRARCFSTRQVRALTELFATDESRYRFFDAAYPYVSDTDRFRELIDQLENEYYKTRFKALVRY